MKVVLWEEKFYDELLERIKQKLLLFSIYKLLVQLKLL